ncbi:hypothetical protein [Methanogenium cariaci]|uniref:hypothetical protein n=1 Tax=Methanogenium cariaci TaxID=2197 RepID=UPI0012F657E3|nr:hypothetical protein [Methanogenium cariaci]
MKGITGTGNYAPVAEGKELFVIESVNDGDVLGYFLQAHRLWRELLFMPTYFHD